ncbi:Zn-ribbon domain-containing OB-fold protein [Thermodesulfobacteriota bacterium]
MTKNKETLPLKKGLWINGSATGGEIQLIGSECSNCGEIHFPSCEMGFCGYCQSDNIEDLNLSTKGKINAYTVVMQRPPVYYQGPVPYAIGFVELPEGVRVETLFTDCDFEELRVGMEVELVLRTLYKDDEGNDIETYMFRPIVD